MGKDKYENELLIQFALDCDIWFHVDKLSSAHVYLRFDGDLEDIPAQLLMDVAQLTKANSIEGNKQSVKVIYTRASNLLKDGSMDVGQVSFKQTKGLVKRISVQERDNKIINRLNKVMLVEF
jgi:predicted ribosome quality control (RQC) complex YloA/Tae2 family protein